MLMKRLAWALSLVGCLGAPMTLNADTSTSQSNDPMVSLGARVNAVLAADRLAVKASAPNLLDKLFNRATKSGPDGFEYSRRFLAELPEAKGGAEWQCLTEALYFEARGESVRGQFAVAEVILNRVRSSRFPDTVCGVVNQGTGQKFRCQFTYTCDGLAETISEPRAWKRLGKIADLMLSGEAPGNLTGSATHYHTNAVAPKWSRVFAPTATIGVHHFYKMTAS